MTMVLTLFALINESSHAIDLCGVFTTDLQLKEFIVDVQRFGFFICSHLYICKFSYDCFYQKIRTISYVGTNLNDTCVCIVFNLVMLYVGI